MSTKVTFRHMKTDEALHDAAIYAAEKFEKFTDLITSIDVIFTNENSKEVEFTLRVNGNVIVAKESSDDFHKSLNEAEDKVIRQLKKYKEKLSN